MLVLFVKSHLALFDTPVNVAAHVRKDGTVVKPHTRIQKVAMRQTSLFERHAAPDATPTARRSKLDVFLSVASCTMTLVRSYLKSFSKTVSTWQPKVCSS